MDLLILGCGNMAGAMLHAWLPLLEQQHWKQVWILRAAQAQRYRLEGNPIFQRLSSRFHFCNSLAELAELAAQNRIHFAQIVLGMKPQLIRREFAACLALDEQSLWLTMAAGLPLAWYQKQKTGLRILRIMPNLGAQVGQSANLLYRNQDLQWSDAEQELLHRMAQAIGPTVWCESEEQLDAATPITGSGPAYYYLLTELLQQELEKQNFSSLTAQHLAEATFLGAAAYLANIRQEKAVNTGASTNDQGTESLCAELREMVSSKAGITEAALSVLMPQLTSVMPQAIARGIERNRQLQDS